MRLGKFLLSLLFLVFVAEIIIISPKDVDDQAEVGAGAGDQEAQAVDNQRSAVEQLMRGAHLVETRDGEKEWELWAESATAYKQKPLWSLVKVKTRIYGDDGVYFVVTGEEGAIDVKTKDMTIKGEVKIRSSNGYVFKTDEMTYHSQNRFLMAPLAVTMWGPRDDQGHSLFLKGRSMEADMSSSQMRVNKEVKGEKVFPKAKVLLIRSQQAIFSGKSNSARFVGDVVMDYETMRITGPEAIFEYAQKTDLVKSVQVVGGVRVSDRDKWATSQNMNVNFDLDRYVFRGSPRVVQNNDELLGEEIVFLDGGRKVEVFKAKAKVDDLRLERTN